MKVLDVEPLLCQKFPVKGVIRWLSPLVNGALKLAYPIPKRLPPEGTEFKEIKRFDKRFGRFWDRIKGDYPIMAVKDSAFLNWRYIDIPHMAYRAIALEKKESAEILGFIVLGKEEHDFRGGQIVDLLTPRNADGIIIVVEVSITERLLSDSFVTQIQAPEGFNTCPPSATHTVQMLLDRPPQQPFHSTWSCRS